MLQGWFTLITGCGVLKKRKINAQKRAELNGCDLTGGAFLPGGKLSTRFSFVLHSVELCVLVDRTKIAPKEWFPRKELQLFFFSFEVNSR